MCVGFLRFGVPKEPRYATASDEGSAVHGQAVVSLKHPLFKDPSPVRHLVLLPYNHIYDDLLLEIEGRKFRRYAHSMNDLEPQ